MKKSELRFILKNLQTRVEMLENEQGFTDAVVEDLSMRVAELERKLPDESLSRAGRELEVAQGPLLRRVDSLERIQNMILDKNRDLTCRVAELEQRAKQAEQGPEPFPNSWTVSYPPVTYTINSHA